MAWRAAVVPVAATKGRAAGGRAAGSRAQLTPTVPATDARERAIDAMVHWAREGSQPVWLVEGGPGVGKTALATAVAERLVGHQWSVGWARHGQAGQAVAGAATVGRPALLLVDDAECRADLTDMLTVLANGGVALPVRVIVIARDFGSWWYELLDRLDPADHRVLTSGRTVIGETGISQPVPGAHTVAVREGRPGDTNPQGRAIATLSTADPISAAVLIRLAALVVALPTRVGQLGPASVRDAMRDLFDDEEGYWRRAAAEVSPGGQMPALRAALACAAVISSDGLGDAATVLRRVPALAAGAADRLARLAAWWYSLFGVGAAESGVAAPRLPGWLLDRMPDGVDSNGVSWTVAALNAERRTTQTLAGFVRDAHRDVWPTQRRTWEPRATADAAHEALHRAVRADAPIDEALAWLTQELELGPVELETLEEAISYPTRSLGRTAAVLARRRLDTAETPEQRARLTLQLGARLSELSRWAEARQASEHAVTAYRVLVEEDRGQYLPALADAVANLGSCQAQLGEHEAALEATYEAVALHRELVEADRDGHLSSLARSLTNLSACLSKVSRRQAALGAAGQAVVLYRELTGEYPGRYAHELAAAEHNWRICRQALGQPVAGRQPPPTPG
jgi:tetratricopeptide (TPR) repeat protein